MPVVEDQPFVVDPWADGRKPKKSKKHAKKQKPKQARKNHRRRSITSSDTDFDDIPSPSRRRAGSISSASSSELANEDVIQNEEDLLRCATAKKLYEGPQDDDGFTTWLEEAPKEIAAVAIQKAQRKSHAIVLRYAKSEDQAGDKVFVLSSLVVQSQLLKNAVRSILSKYPMAGTHSKELTFNPPFQPFFHRWSQFEEYLDNCKDEKAQHKYVELLHSILEPELKPLQQEFQSLTKHGAITFDLLWALYPPETVVLGRLYDRDHAFIVKSAQKQYNGNGPMLLITVCCIDWDGFDYGYDELHFEIYKFSGEMKIADLELVPHEYYPDVENQMKRLEERGKEWTTIVQGGYKAFEGWARNPNIFDAAPASHIEGRIIVDGLGAYTHGQMRRRFLRPLKKADNKDSMADLTYDVGEGPYESDDVVIIDSGLPPVAQQGDPLGLCNAPPPSHSPRAPSEVTSKQLPFCRSIVRGFCLTTKKWAEFNVDDIHDISWNDDAFERLVMAASRKRIIRALIKEQGARDVPFDDIIGGKGLGLIMLLSGPPGTGKTLTAESIADALRLPLYVLSASQLGDDIQQIEHALRDVFQLAGKWKAVMLLDEADAFLEKRSNSQVLEERERNKRVAAFLRLLEYYKGTLIMTTNRAINFDEAFHSRIHLTLRFEPLDAQARRAIWEDFLVSSEASYKHADLDKLSQIDVNGREIKNMVKMAKLLAKSQDEGLSIDHVTDVLETSGCSNPSLDL